MARFVFFALAASLAVTDFLGVNAFGPSVDRPASDAMEVDADVLAYLKAQNHSEAAGGAHLWFYYVNDGGQTPEFCRKTGGCRCGDIDAASRMPAALFKPQNILALARYATLTIKSYTSLGMGTAKLQLGKCAEKTDYTCSGRAAVQGINWVTSALMIPICKQQCDCTYTGDPARGCKDQPDDPKAGKWCSLCGPKYNSKIVINLSSMPNPPDEDDSYTPCGDPKFPNNLVETIAANPELTTLYAALKAADLLGPLVSPGPWTLFAPTNKAFKALPPFTLARLLKPKNQAELVDILTYHVVPDSYCALPASTFCSKYLKDGSTLRTQEGKSVAVKLQYIGRPPYQTAVAINGAKIVTPDVRASGAVMHIIDAVLTPPK